MINNEHINTSDTFAEPSQENWDTIFESFKSLLNSPSLDDIFMNMIEPLFKGYITEFTKTEGIEKPTIFLYPNMAANADPHIIDYDADYNDYANVICVGLRNNCGMRDCCNRSDINAAKMIFNH